MKRTSIPAATFALAVLVGVVFPPAAVPADMTQREVTETTTYRGTVTDISPNTSTIVIKSEAQPDPMRYTFNEKTTFVDSAGSVVTREQIRNAPVTVYTVNEGDQRIVTKVIAMKPIGSTVEKKKTTTTTEEVETRD